MKKRLFLLAVLFALAWGMSWDADAATVPDSPWAHPRMFLKAAVLESLQARAARGTDEWNTLKDWNDIHYDDDFSTWQTETRIVNSGWAVNLALEFQVDEDHPMVLADAAYDAIVAIFKGAEAAGYWDSVSVVSRYDYGYNMRFMVLSASLVYDWCYDSLAVEERDYLANMINLWCKDWYINRRSYDDGSSGCHSPSNNYYGGYLSAMISGGYALYYDVATYPARYVSYGRDTLAVQAAKSAKNQTMIWSRWGSYTGATKGGLGGDAWPGYADNNVEFQLNTFRLIADAENSNANDIFSFNYPQEYLMSLMYTLIPHKNFDTEWMVYGFGEGTSRSHIYQSEWYAAINAMATVTEENDTISLAKWWVDTYDVDIDRQTRNYWQEFLFNSPAVEALDPSASAGHAAIGDVWFAAGQSTAYYRNAWHSEASNDISIMLKGGAGRENHMANEWGTFAINAGDNLTPNAKQLWDESDEQSEPFGRRERYPDGSHYGYGNGYGSDWSNNGMFIQPDASITNVNAGICGGLYGKNLFWGIPRVRHLNNTDTLLYYSVDLTPVYNNDYLVSNGRNSHVISKDVEWVYIKSDSMLLMLDRAKTKESDYRRLLPWTCPTHTHVCTNILSAGYESNKQWQLWAEDAPIAIGTRNWRINGKSEVCDLIVRTDYPRIGVTSTATYRSRYVTPTSYYPAAWRIIDSLSAPNAEYITLHSMKIVPDAEEFTNLVPTCNRGKMAVSSFRSNRDTGLDYLVAFNANVNVNDNMFTGDSIIIGHLGVPRTTTRCIIANTTKNTTYYWKARTFSDSMSVTVAMHNPGTYTTATSDTSGILIFDTSVQAPVCYISKPFIYFGEVSVGACSDPEQEFYITNTGQGTIAGTIRITGGTPPNQSIPFSITSGDGDYELAHDETLTVSIKYCPAIPTTSFNYVNTGVCNSVTLIGRGIDLPACGIAEPYIRFGYALPLVVSDAKYFHITNLGGGVLTGTVTSPSDEFQVQTGTESYSLERGESHAVGVMFAPNGTGIRSCLIDIGATNCSKKIQCIGYGQRSAEEPKDPEIDKKVKADD
jgi:hypothetical protein